MSSSPRIFLGPVETAGYFAHLRKGLEELGADVTFLDVGQHRYAYGGDTPTRWCTWHRGAARRRWQTPYLAARLFWIIVVHVTRAVLFASALLRHDVFIFSGRTFYASLRDLALLKRFGKRIIFIFLGSDSRPPYLSGKGIPSGPVDGDRLAKSTRKTKERVHLIERYADVLVASPFSAHLHERPYVSFFDVGFPTSGITSPATDAIETPLRRDVVVLHAPSDESGKGSARIREVVGRLQARGYAIDFRELQGRPNHEVHAELARCDFVIDQLYSDTPMAGFAREAALHGKPAIVGTYAADAFERGSVSGTMPPCLWTLPEQLESAVERMATNPSLRDYLGQRARRFVTTEWAAINVAKRLLELSELHTGVLHDPVRTRYTAGYGLSRERLREMLRAVLKTDGGDALQLADKPLLRSALLREAEGVAAPAVRQTRAAA